MIKDIIDNLIKEAMKSGQKERLSTLRMIKTKLSYANTSGKEYTDLVEQEALLNMVKQIKQSATAYAQIGDNDNYDSCQDELKIVEEFLPKQMSEQEIAEYIAEMSSVIDVKKDRKIIFDSLKGKADSAIINKIINSYISYDSSARNTVKL